jgi:hypothetical protein
VGDKISERSEPPYLLEEPCEHFGTVIGDLGHAFCQDCGAYLGRWEDDTRYAQPRDESCDRL